MSDYGVVLPAETWTEIREREKMSDDEINEASGHDELAALELYKRTLRRQMDRYVPHHMREPIEKYILFGQRVGEFLYALLSNDLMEAFGRADDINRERMFDWTCFLFMHAPADCYRSPSNVKRWLAQGGIYGRALSTNKAESRFGRQTGRSGRGASVI